MNTSSQENWFTSLSLRTRVALLALVALLMVLPRTFDPVIPKDVEGRLAEKTREMIATGDWWVVRMNGEEDLTKPPLYMWMAASLALLAGKLTPFILRLPNILAIAALVPIVYVFARRFLSEMAALWAGVSIVTTYLFFLHTGYANFDLQVTLWIFIATIFLYFYLSGERSISHLAMAVSAMIIGQMIKGPLALAVPLLVIITWCVFDRRFVALKDVRLGFGFVLALVAGNYWAISMIISTQTATQTFWTETLQRFTEENRSHAEPIYYHVLHIFPYMLPWSIFVPFLLYRLWKDREFRQRPLVRFASAWCLGGIVFYSAASSKTGFHLLPVYPAFLLLTAAWLETWPPSGWVRRIALGLALALVALFPAIFLAVEKNEGIPLYKLSRELEPILKDRPLYFFKRYRPQLTFYLNRRIPEIDDRQQMDDILRQEPQAIFIVKASDDFMKNLPPGFVVLAPEDPHEGNHDYFALGQK